MRDYYSILHLSRSASTDQIKKAFYRMSMRYHPDRLHGSLQKPGRHHYHDILEAYKTLRDPKSRRLYDLSLQRRTLPVIRRPLKSAGGFRSSRYVEPDPTTKRTQGPTEAESWDAVILHTIAVATGLILYIIIHRCSSWRPS